ncbi:MAG: alpha/beta hydrolase [Pirellulaceae bacterium]|nr:alpha/beta hydrolase [Pirellulaceae bacterium]
MRNRWQRHGRIAVRLIVVATTAVVGGAATIPSLMPKGEKSSVALSSSAESFAPQSATSVSQKNVNSTPTAPSPTSSAGIERVRVYYATDRQLFQANNPHLWITAIAPGFLCVLLTLVLVAGCFAGKRRWAWGLGSCLGLFVCYILVGQTAIKVGHLMRLAQQESVWFSGGRFAATTSYPLHLGVSDVTLPPNHQRGVIERPSVFSFEFTEREDRHVIVQRIEEMDVDSYFDSLRDRISFSPDQSALIYIHGYNVEFEEALHRTAQLSHDIQFDGAPILYSWPSNGQLVRYRRDESNVEWSAAHLELFLADVHKRSGVKRLHVIAHSMGNRALVGALQLLQLKYPYEQPMLSQVILAAPDLDTEVFRDRYASAVHTCASQVTLYASATDRALLASVKLNGFQRLGLTSNPQPTVAGVDLVDVTPVDTSLLGHSYYGSHPLMIRELKSLIHDGVSPEKRNWLTTLADQRMPPLWRFVPELAAQAMQSNVQR